MENMWNVSRKVDQVITQLKMQEYDMSRFGLEPNRVILGRYIYDILEREFRYGRYSVIEHYNDNDTVAYMMGLPITIDEKNKWLIKMCSGFEMDGKDLLYPDKIDPEVLKDRF